MQNVQEVPKEIDMMRIKAMLSNIRGNIFKYLYREGVNVEGGGVVIIR